MKVVLQYLQVLYIRNQNTNIKTIFKIIGAAAAAANLLFELKFQKKKMINLQITRKEM